MIKQLGNERASLSGRLVRSQESVIELQREVIHNIQAKYEQLSTLQSTVKSSVEEWVRSSVEESVKTEIMTYSRLACRDVDFRIFLCSDTSLGKRARS